MTLVIGAKLLEGILLVSDTREINEKTGESTTELKRKITQITPGIFLGGAGSENNGHTARILRNCLYSSSKDYTSQNIREEILKLYSNVNSFHEKHHNYKSAVGALLIAEYYKETRNFNLLHINGFAGYSSFNILNNFKDHEVIGMNEQIRVDVKEQIQKVLDNLSVEELKDDKLYEKIAKRFHEIIYNQAHFAVGNKVYCTYLTEVNKKPACSLFHLSATGQLTSLNLDNEEKGGELISL